MVWILIYTWWEEHCSMDWHGRQSCIYPFLTESTADIIDCINLFTLFMEKIVRWLYVCIKSWTVNGVVIPCVRQTDMIAWQMFRSSGRNGPRKITSFLLQGTFPGSLWVRIQFRWHKEECRLVEYKCHIRTLIHPWSEQLS